MPAPARAPRDGCTLRAGLGAVRAGARVAVGLTAVAGCGTADHAAIFDWPEVRAVVGLEIAEAVEVVFAEDRDAGAARVLPLPEDAELWVLGLDTTLEGAALALDPRGVLVVDELGPPLPPVVRAARVDREGVARVVDPDGPEAQATRARVRVPGAPCARLERARGAAVVEWPGEPSVSFVAAYGPRAAVVGFRDASTSTGAPTYAQLWQVVDDRATRLDVPELTAQSRGFAEADGTVWVLAPVRTSTRALWCHFAPGARWDGSRCARGLGAVPRAPTAMAGGRVRGRLEVFAVGVDQWLHYAIEDDAGSLVWQRLFQGGREDTPRCAVNPRVDVLEWLGPGTVRLGYLSGPLERVTLSGGAVERAPEFSPSSVEARSCRTAHVAAPGLGELFARMPPFDGVGTPPFDFFWRRTPESPWAPLDVFVDDPRYFLFEVSGVAVGAGTVATVFAFEPRRPDVVPARCAATPLPGLAVGVSRWGEEIAIATEGSVDTFPVKPTTLSWYALLR